MLLACGGASAALAGWGAVSGLLLLACLTLRLRRTVHDPYAAMPLALVVVVTTALAWAELAAVMRWPALHSPWANRCLLAVACMATAVVEVRRQGRAPARSTPGFSLVAALPALPPLAMVLTGAALAVRAPAERVQWFLDGDNPRHVYLVADEWADGFLDYAAEGYPRAWHSTLATLWGASGPSLDADGLLSLIDLSAGALWVLFTSVVLAVVWLTRSVCRSLAVTGVGVQLASLGAGATVMLTVFMGNYMSNGFQTSLLAVLVLLVIAATVAGRTDRAFTSVLVGAACLAVMANTWQLAVPAAVLALGAAAHAAVQQGHGRRAASVLVVATALALPGVVGVVTQRGLSHATEAGVTAPLPVFWLSAAVVTALAVALTCRGPVRVVAWMVLVTAATACAVAAVLAIPPSQYYPSKLLWKAAVVGVPLVWGFAAHLLRGSSLANHHAVRAVAAGCVGLYAVFGVAHLTAAVNSGWSAVDAVVVRSLVSAPGADRAQVVWTSDREDDTIARILLDFYSVGRTATRTVQHPASLAEECDLLTAAVDPAVISTEPETEVRARYACAPRLRLVRPDSPE